MRAVSTRRTAGCASIVVILATGLFGLSGGGVADAMPTHRPTVPMCTASDVSMAASTDRAAYAPGQTVAMTSSVRNTSDASCAIALGRQPGSSPEFLIDNSSGTQVWNRCWIDDEPFPCSQVFQPHTLRRGHTYKQKASWDQGSGPAGGPVVRVPPGRYTLSTSYAFLPIVATASFKIVAKDAAMTARCTAWSARNCRRVPQRS
jgi:Intracellular proteinase inhibitor